MAGTIGPVCKAHSARSASMAESSEVPVTQAVVFRTSLIVLATTYRAGFSPTPKA